jgi:hypothetical protein
MKTAYIIKNDTLIAEVDTEMKNGSVIDFSFEVTTDCFTDRELLINARTGKISRAKKWAKIASEEYVRFADEINEGEFLVGNYC